MIDLDELPDRMEFESVWFEVLAKKYPWFKKLLQETPFDQINEKLGKYRSAYHWIVEGSSGWADCMAYRHWWNRMEEEGKLEYWFHLFGEDEKFKRIMEREDAEKKERDERRSAMFRSIEAKRDAEREAYERAIKE